jgi:hypothetical protein
MEDHMSPIPFAVLFAALLVSACGGASDASVDRRQREGADGVWLGDLDVPPGFRVLDSRGDLVLGVWPDANDGPRVHLHTIVRAQQP